MLCTLVLCLRKAEQLLVNKAQKDVSLEQKYKIEVFLTMVDKFTASLSSRFSQLNIYKRKFDLILRLPVLNQQDLEVERKVIQTQCEQLSTVLGNVVDKTDLQAELAFFVNLPNRQQLHSALSPLNYLVKQKITDTLPNLHTALKIVATMPVFVVPGERSFSKLKLIKTYLRSRMSQYRLNGLAMMSIERKISKQIGFTEIIDQFAPCKARRQQFVAYLKFAFFWLYKENQYEFLTHPKIKGLDGRLEPPTSGLPVHCSTT